MPARMLIGVGALLTAALLLLAGRWMVEAYGHARFEAGVATGRLDSMAEAARIKADAATTAIAAEQRLTTVERKHGDEIARIAAAAEQTSNEARNYAQTAAGRVDCLGAERVRGIEASRAILFPDTAATGAGTRDP